MEDSLIQRTFDTELVRRVMRHPELKKRSRIEDLELLDPENQEDVYYLLPLKGTEVLGVLILHKVNENICYQAHANFLPRYWGTGLEEYSKEGIQWMFDNTDCEKIVAYAPDKYPEVKAHCLKAGMEVEGVLKNNTKINNELFDETVLGVSKWPQQH